MSPRGNANWQSPCLAKIARSSLSGEFKRTPDALNRIEQEFHGGLLREKLEQDLLAPILRSSVLWQPERQAESAWLEHVPFAFWLVDVFRPRLVVELGTQRGVSYSAICQAVKTLKLPTACFAIDTWQGDEHAGSYSDEVYREFAAFHDRHYAAFSRLVRSTFDEALPHFEDGSIDLLHIDGQHAYERVRHDYEILVAETVGRRGRSVSRRQCSGARFRRLSAVE